MYRALIIHEGIIYTFNTFSSFISKKSVVFLWLQNKIVGSTMNFRNFMLFSSIPNFRTNTSCNKRLHLEINGSLICADFVSALYCQLQANEGTSEAFCCKENWRFLDK